jgi:hypothetical protein
MYEILMITGIVVAAAFIAALLRLGHDRSDARRRNTPPPMVDLTPRQGRGRVPDDKRPNNKGW